MSINPLIIVGDCIDVMRSLPDASVDAVITDPPYGIRFMGKAWDGADIETVAAQQAERRDRRGEGERGERGRTVSGFAGASSAAGEYDLRPSANRAYQEWCEAWAAECFRLLKPGGHLLSFSGTRTSHRLASGIEDAGFEIRDTLTWLYGSGFPKSLDVSKAIDKSAGFTKQGAKTIDEGAVTPDAQTWQGWGTALKPAHEPITLARKPIAGTVAGNVLAYGTGALHIDACRIEASGRPARSNAESASGLTGKGGAVTFGEYAVRGSVAVGETDQGRWPANVILSHHPDCTPTGETRSVKSDGHHPAKRGAGGLSTSGHAGQEALDERYADGETIEVWECHPDCAVRILDAQSGETKSSGGKGAASQATALAGHVYGSYSGETLGGNAGGLGDKGGASRFYYVAKASKRERGGQHNTHPTVKPLALMRWLVRLVAPPGALILDPFLGSGTTALACISEGVEWVGIEQDASYAEIATQRIAAHEPQIALL